MNRTALLAITLLFGGSTLLLAELRWFRRAGLTERLGRFGPVAAAAPARGGALSVQSFREVIGPLVTSAGDRLLHLLGRHDSLTITLQRLHAPVDGTTFRLRQASWAGAGFAAATAAAIALGPPPLFSALFLLGAPLLAVLLVEQRLVTASARRAQAANEEFPVVLEQLAMLLGAGYSLGSALSRLGTRGHGVIAADLRRVTNRVRQGLSEAEALAEWAAISASPDIRRLVDVLALNGSGVDLGSLVTEEARAARREAHRRTLELIERRAQMVWIPVTIATLVPGVLFMAIPFLQAMRDFSAL